MSSPTLYIQHHVREREYKRLIASIGNASPADQKDLVAIALHNNREGQRADAVRALTGKSVTVYNGCMYAGGLRNCEVGEGTATECFTLLERNETGMIVVSIKVTPQMIIFWGDAL